MQSRNWNLGIGLLFLAFSTFALFWWIPTDTETGVIVEERRSVVVGDAMAPTMVAIAMLLVSLALIASTLTRTPQRDDVIEYTIGISPSNLASLLTMAIALVCSMAMMVWAGPFVVGLLQSAGFDLQNYRLLSDTIPYKYIGFALGGFVLVLGLIAWIEGRVRPRAVLTALGAVAVLIIIYDVPFDSLLLPPNGSQQ